MTEKPKTVQRHLTPPASPSDLRHPAADVFFEVFSLARMRGELLGETLLQPDQVLQRAAGGACFHVIQDAGCQLRLNGTDETTRLVPGDILFVPHGQAHQLHSAADASPDLPARITSGVFQFEGGCGQALIQGLPGVLQVSCQGEDPNDLIGSREWLSLTVAAMQKEVQNPSIGSRIMLSRIIDLMFIWAVRHWLAHAPQGISGWIAALRDPLIGQALALLHAEPGAVWSVERLAGLVNQSRSNLAQRFTHLVGQSPMRYLMHWRMQLAGQRLQTSSLRISQIAEQLGYESEAAFSRAFRREFGVAPSEYRSRG
ncbi:AraC family transcriptional regulator [Pseudomonas chlororaphis]|uniref:AraC family transcriptional regulator n=1 Tax=Pseudomonas chlororaphis TaxID=587753 RepID=A0AAX3G4I8_9PSED|nr:AraC family transcriptional regulator [Pseudomonas chlororaphis]AZC37127.1 Transcriptional regulator, AraC family [Pseudomonas chlororaphis subsp. piscium]AZC43673.1 Transcriptional regulator, AraC family [Pseudomonas chlororaphis subsp. piscium]AZC95387.1 Transcriptional regulator, AraC family [Pseudomonas chlororaphis subsp. piscium]UQS87874.1 AraC family transcriptional regulator [Pseudomonas chlororaphis subsp. piscium]WDG75542.1 AraC family transcriptional regulator [Pseudomonas chloro